MLYGLLTVVELGLLVFCVLDVLRTPQPQVRHLPKLLWLLLVVVLPLAGGTAWLLLGRPRPVRSRLDGRSSGRDPAAHDRPRRAAALNPDDDAAFLAQLEARVDAQRAAAEAQRREQLAAEQTRRAAEREPRRDRDA